MYHQVRLFGIVGDQVHGKIVRAFHSFMHHENVGSYDRALTRLEDHRTDGQRRRSTPLQNLDIGFFLKP